MFEKIKKLPQNDKIEIAIFAKKMFESSKQNCDRRGDWEGTLFYEEQIQEMQKTIKQLILKED